MNWGNKTLEIYENNFEVSLRNKKILFIMGSTRISGGTNIIFQYASKLSETGASVDVVSILDKVNQGIEWNGKYQNFNFISIDSATAKYYDLVICTWWPTVLTLRHLNFDTSLYFVQSIESRFIKSQRNLSLEKEIFSLYYSGIPMVTVANWMQRFLFESTGNLPWVVKNGIDKSLFYPEENFSDAKCKSLRVLIEGDLDSDFKAVKETYESIKDIKGIQIVYVSPSDRKLEGGANNINKVEFGHMGKVYRNADLLVKMSRVEGMFGPPLEMFHCGGTAIVSKVSGYSEYIEDGANALAVDVDDFDGLRKTVSNLSQDRELLHKLKLGALQTANTWPSVLQSSREFVQICHMLIRSRLKWSPQWKVLEDLKVLIEREDGDFLSNYRVFPDLP